MRRLVAAAVAPGGLWTARRNTLLLVPPRGLQSGGLRPGRPGVRSGGSSLTSWAGATRSCCSTSRPRVSGRREMESSSSRPRYGGRAVRSRAVSRCSHRLHSLTVVVGNLFFFIFCTLFGELHFCRRVEPLRVGLSPPLHPQTRPSFLPSRFCLLPQGHGQPSPASRLLGPGRPRGDPRLPQSPR